MPSATTVSGPRRTDAGLTGIVLKLGDAAAILIAFAVVLATTGRFDLSSIIVVPLAAGVGLSAFWASGLWNPRVTVMRWIELSKVTRAVAILAAGVLTLDQMLRLGASTQAIVIASALAWLLTVASRSIHRSWLTHQRRAGRFTRRAIIIGTDARALEVIRLFAIHPEAGVRIVGVIGSRHDARRAGLDDLWLGEHHDTPACWRRTRARRSSSAPRTCGPRWCSRSCTPATGRTGRCCSTPACPGSTHDG